MIRFTVDRQHPETLLAEDYANGEYDDCPVCGRMFACYGKAACPNYHAPYSRELIKTNKDTNSKPFPI